MRSRKESDNKNEKNKQVIRLPYDQCFGITKKYKLIKQKYGKLYYSDISRVTKYNCAHVSVLVEHL